MNNVNMGNMNPMAGGPVGPAMPMMNNGAVVPAAAPRPQQQINESNKHLLNTYIYEYFLRNDMIDCARAILNSDPGIKVQDGPNARRDENGNIIGNGVGAESMDVDNKDGIDGKGPDGLPQPLIPNPSMDNPFLYEWFCLFWDMFNAQKGKSGNGQVNSYMNHTQNQSRMRQSQQQEMLRNMRPDLTPQQHQLQMMRMQQNGGMGMAMKGNNLPRTAMANSQNNPQMMHMLQQQQQQQAQQKQGQMQRDPSDMDGNRARPSSPGSAENAPSPSKRPRLEGAPFNPAQGGMIPNGRPAGQGMPGQGMPGQQVGNDPSSSHQQTTQRLLHAGIDPSQLNPEQFATFQNQSQAVQQKTIATYAHTLQQQQSQQMKQPMQTANGPPGQGSPMVPQGPDGAASINTFYNAEGMAGPGAMRPAGPNGNQQAGGSNHALQDYQMQLMLLEQQNKKRLMMARQEQDGGNNMQMPRDGPTGGPGGPGAPPGAAAPFQGASPQGARPGASPNPNEMKRGPQMNPAGMGSPMAEGAQSRGSPNAMNFMGNQMDPNQAPHFFKENMNGMAAGGNMPGGPQMNGGMRPPSSHPGQPQFSGPMNPQQQQMMAARQQGQMAGQPGQPMQWQQQQQGGPGGPNGNQMVPQGQQPQQPQGTPQQRNAMPPPAQPAAAAATANARNTSSPQVSNAAAPPTPSQANKAAPKKKDNKNAKDKRSAAQKKSNTNLNSTAGATPAADSAAENEAPTPATPITPVNPQQNIPRPGPNAGPNQAMPNGQAPAPVPQQAAAPMVPPPEPNQNQGFNMEGMADFGSLDFANPLASNDVLNDFDFDSFLHDNEAGDGGFDFSTAGAFMDTDGIET